MTTVVNDVRAARMARPSEDTLLQMSDVSVIYDGEVTPVLQNIHFSLHKGETVLFLGPSGGGKSTLAMLIADLIPKSVEAAVRGEIERSALLSQPGSIGYVFQDPDAQFCMIEAGDEIAFGMENHSILPGEMSERIQSALSDVHTRIDLTAIHSNFSGGMKQKLAIASALAMDPELLIFDEPTANLDPQSSRVVFEEIRRLREASSKTMIVIEHKFESLLPFVDRVVLFNRTGQIHRAGNPQEVFLEEWDWIIQMGIVPTWKQNPFLSIQDSVPEPRASRFPALEHYRRLSPDGNARTAFTFENASLEYPTKKVWSHVDLEIPNGSFTAIVGPNGSGKSSLLQVMAGLQKLSSGENRVFEISMRKWNKTKLSQDVSFCFQNPEYQFIYNTVADELANRHVGEHIPVEVDELLRQFGLGDYATHSPFALSQGEKRRLSVACMVRDEHRAYLLDEPTFGQDARTEHAIMERLKELYERGKTVVMTTHNMDLVAKYATHVVVVSDGAVQFFGEVEALFADEFLMRRAHLLDDVYDGCDPTVERRSGDKTSRGVDSDVDAIPSRTDLEGDHSKGTVSVEQAPGAAYGKRAPVTHLNPPWQMLSSMGAAIIAMLAHNIWESLAEFCIPVLLMMIFAWQSPIRIVKRFSPFLIFYFLYVLAITVNAKPIPGAHIYTFLWWHYSFPNLVQGLTLAFRMLAVVGYTILFFTSADITDLIVGLSKNFKLAPKFAYGILAGLRVVPLFHSEWAKLKQARQVRGKESRVLFRPVTYALPLLSQAIRMSERVAIAMEARGLYGRAAESSLHRTFYRDIQVHWWDYLYFLGVCTLSVSVILVF